MTLAIECIAAVSVLLLRDRMAAAVAGGVRSGGRARAGELRDRMAFLQPGDRMDLETARYDVWRRAVTASLRGEAVLRVSRELAEEGRGQEGVGPDIPEAGGTPSR